MFRWTRRNISHKQEQVLDKLLRLRILVAIDARFPLNSGHLCVVVLSYANCREEQQ